MDIRSLRLLAGFTQADAARLARVSIRTWRRRERQGHRLTERWLRYECGLVPGWPPGWRARPEGVQIDGGRVIPFAMIEAAPWLVGLVEESARPAVYSRLERAGL